MTGPIEITYLTSSPSKKAENAVLHEQGVLDDGRKVFEAFTFLIVDNTIKETLDVRLEEIVKAEAKGAYALLKRPCIVEHAGLVFEEYADDGYPGGLTKPMWNTLKQDRFLAETQSRGRRATAVAVIGYCDGVQVHTFVGETSGRLSTEPRGVSDFYWDTVFIPDGQVDAELTYAEIVERDGAARKVIEFSQSTKAMMAFLGWRLKNHPSMWTGSD